VVVEYRYASSRELQSSDDLDQLKPALSVVPDANGKPLSDRGMHHQLSVSRKLGSRVLSASAYIDRLSYGAIGGSGLMSGSSLQLANAVADPTTGTFRSGRPRIFGARSERFADADADAGAIGMGGIRPRNGSCAAMATW
jgi:hypothetical protein